MRLKHIKLSGFKSFVDPTTVSVPGRLVGVVGPNGCGKSNVIDAVRWVMGESSAKNLRGDSMADVIFNGSSARKPISKASVELVFDNTEGKAPGPYAQFNEIGIRRELTRDGQSNYFINKGRCRRRDITDIFLGTGMGPRSYSIIEQGMVSRIIEAKPDDLRVLIEEAAGVSKYKERRRETETRIRHTRENLSRVEDIRGELDANLRRLKRQSRAAARYKELKEEERRKRAQLMSLRWRALDLEARARDGELSKRRTDLDAKIATQREIEKNIERLRQQQTECNDSFNAIQAEYYENGAGISGAEQKLEHLVQTRAQQQQEMQRLAETRAETIRHLQQDQARVTTLRQQLEQIAPRVEQAKQALDDALQTKHSAAERFNTWQAGWEGFAAEAAQPEQQRAVQRSRIEEYEQQLLSLSQREQRLRGTLSELVGQTRSGDYESLKEQAREHDRLCENLSADLENLDRKILEKREIIDSINDDMRAARDRVHELSSRLTSLRELQTAALGAHDQTFSEWLAASGLVDAPRLASTLNVDPEWALAVDRVLGDRAGAVCVEDLQDIDISTRNMTDAELLLIEADTQRPESNRPCLLDKVECEAAGLAAWLAHVYLCADYAQALGLRGGLKHHESLITADGVWMGRNWISVADRSGSGSGVLARDREIEEVAGALEKSEQTLSGVETRLREEQQLMGALEEDQSDTRRTLARETEQRAVLQNRLGRLEAQQGESAKRRQQTEMDLAELRQQINQTGEIVSTARLRMQDAEQATRTIAERRAQLLQQREVLDDELRRANAEADAAQETRHGVDFEMQRTRSELESAEENVRRLQTQYSGTAKRHQDLENLLNQDTSPEQGLKETLDQLLRQRIEIERRLADARREVGNIDGSIRDEEQQRLGQERLVQEIREAMEQVHITRQETIVRRDTVAEQIAENDYDAETLLREMPEDAAENQWHEELEKLVKQIERIGPVNLVAIEEFDEQSERKTHLDKQYEDLVEALTTLESVIRKIDRETRARFGATFESLNQRFQEFFPRLFGGGSAYLEMTDADVLETGVSVMARPPGKRNSTIHLLSGGEKALTAVSLLFSFFDLNPAPFCMLDEVDAPLDDANVERYSQVLKTLSDRTQLIFITHNKITMETADTLIGVTMMEPGVSRLVSVDVQDAIEMAAQ